MNNFSELIARYRNGHLNSQLTEQLEELVKACELHHKAGKLTITLTLNPKADGEIQSAIKFVKTEPKRDTMESILFSTPEGKLLPYNPSQADMFNRDDVKVIGESEEPKTTKTFRA